MGEAQIHLVVADSRDTRGKARYGKWEMATGTHTHTTPLNWEDDCAAHSANHLATYRITSWLLVAWAGNLRNSGAGQPGWRGQNFGLLVWLDSHIRNERCPAEPPGAVRLSAHFDDPGTLASPMVSLIRAQRQLAPSIIAMLIHGQSDCFPIPRRTVDERRGQ